MIDATTFRQIYNDFAKDGVLTDSTIMNFPRRKSNTCEQRNLSMQIAIELYPTVDPADGEYALSAVIKYDKDVLTLRRAYLAHCAKKAGIKLAMKRKGVHNTRDIILAQGPWTETADPASVPASLPMPVEISDIESLQPFFDFIRGDSTMKGTPGLEPYYNVPIIEYPKGVVYEDGRIDLCKQVLGPSHIYQCMEALSENQQIRHFLLGNNIIGP